MNTEVLVLVSAIASVISALTLILVLLKVGKLSAVAELKADQMTGTAVTAKDLGGELGGAIEAAFKNHVPQPDKSAAALASAVEQAVKKAGESIESLHKNMLSTQGQMTEKWAGHEKATTTSLETARKALDEASGKLGSVLSSATEKLQAAASSLGQQLEKASGDMAGRIKSSYEPSLASLQTALTAHAQQLEKIESGSRDQLKTALSQHAESVQKSSQALAGQLDKIMQLEKEIQQVLHVQQVVDGTLKSVAAADEFKQTLSDLRKHLEVSDSLIKEVAKPRTIRLVESET